MDITPQLAEARRLLDGDAPKPATRQAIGALAAMGLLAAAAMLMAGAVVLGPGVQFEDPAPVASVVS
ncbi:peptidoglycan-binding protein [Brevundimonas sp.]|uniref:peptidoglycan-binding protein n=1 Tax=Brevundimonas sp. TaxID=1871086 RepID=UPI001DD89B3A|nr:peptidoglycan-binding protein [Brevundimonas sp.]MBL0947742.1 peptidoglycan-binding protein [Brevundimonas sp.]